MENPSEVTISEPIYQKLINLEIAIQNLSYRSSQLNPEVEAPSSFLSNLNKHGFLIWDKGNYSVVQVHVLDQFLTAEQFIKEQTCDIQNMPNLREVFSIEEKTEPNPVIIGSYHCSIQQIEELKKNLNQKIADGEIPPNLNIGGGYESCGYQAIKNSIIISKNLENEPFSYLELNDLTYANKIFGKAKINKLLNLNEGQEGLWRSKVLQHRIELLKSSIQTSHRAIEKALINIQKDLEKLRELLEKLEQSSNDLETEKQIKQLWENIISQKDNTSYEVEQAKIANQNLKEVNAKPEDLELAENLILIASQNDVKATDLWQIAFDLMPTRLVVKQTAKSTEEIEESYDIDEYEDNDEDIDEDDDNSEEYENDSDEDEDNNDLEEFQESGELSTKKESSSFNLEQSERGGENLAVSDMDYLYELLQEKDNLPESTVVGAVELGVEPSELGPVTEEIGNILLERIIELLSKSIFKQHIVFMGGAGHWVTLVIRIINNRLYYIIADSTNEQRFNVNLNRKGIYITKAIQKIIDGTKDLLLKLTD